MKKLIVKWDKYEAENLHSFEVIWSLDGVDYNPRTVDADKTSAEAPFLEAVNGKAVSVQVVAVGKDGSRSAAPKAEITVNADGTDGKMAPVKPVKGVPEVKGLKVELVNLDEESRRQAEAKLKDLEAEVSELRQNLAKEKAEETAKAAEVSKVAEASKTNEAAKAESDKLAADATVNSVVIPEVKHTKGH